MSDTRIKSINWKKRSFELGKTIKQFTCQFLARNISHKPAVTRQEVDLYWTWQVVKAYPQSDDPKRIFLLDQLSSPMAQILWEKRENEQAFKQKREKQKESGFHHIDRDLTKRERRNYPFAIIMTHAVHGEVIVPDLLRCPLRKVSYLDLIPKILAANPSKDLKTPVLHELWDAILSKVYDYEYDWREDKKHEAQSAASNNHLNPFADSSRSKKRKHSDVEQPSVETEAPLAKKKAPPSSLNAHNPPKKHSALEHRHFSLALRPRPQQSNEIPEPMHIEQSQQGITQLQNDRSLDPRPEDG